MTGPLLRLQPEGRREGGEGGAKWGTCLRETVGGHPPLRISQWRSTPKVLGAPLGSEIPRGGPQGVSSCV